MSGKAHETLVRDQFGARAQAYVTSQVHAQGEDLARLGGLLAERPAERLLDLGCGGGHVSFLASPHAGAVVAYDLSAEMVATVAGEAKARGLGNIATRQGAVEHLPFAAGAFDVVASRYSAHHWQDFAAGLKEARRVLTPGGRAFFIDSMSPGPALADTFLQTIEMLRDPSHVRSYSQADWVRAVTEAGFRMTQVTFYRVRLEFASWVARSGTPEAHVAAIRSLQSRMSAEVVNRFAIEPDGSFLLDVMMLEATV